MKLIKVKIISIISFVFLISCNSEIYYKTYLKYKKVNDGNVVWVDFATTESVK